MTRQADLLAPILFAARIACVGRQTLHRDAGVPFQQLKHLHAATAQSEGSELPTIAGRAGFRRTSLLLRRVRADAGAFPEATPRRADRRRTRPLVEWITRSRCASIGAKGLALKHHRSFTGPGARVQLAVVYWRDARCGEGANFAVARTASRRSEVRRSGATAHRSDTKNRPPHWHASREMHHGGD